MTIARHLGSRNFPSSVLSIMRMEFATPIHSAEEKKYNGRETEVLVRIESRFMSIPIGNDYPIEELPFTV